MKKIILIAAFIVALESCKKSTADGVTINIENLTSYTLDSVQLIYDTSGYVYSSVLPGNSSEYHLFKNLPDDAAAPADLNNEKIVAGRLIPPNSYPVIMLANGKYTLQIFPDSTLLYGYNSRFIKN